MKATNLILFAAAGAAGLCLGRRFASEVEFEWRARVVMITGGSRGLGLVLARQLAGLGARVIICARDEQELARARQDILNTAQDGGDVATFACDLRDERQTAIMMEEAQRLVGPIEVLINNAGTITMGPLEEMRDEDFQEAMDLYFWAPLRTMRAVIPGMQQRGRGQIVNISSIGGVVPVPHLTPYCAGKFALTGLSQSMRAELAKDGIGVTTICPFVMRTGSQVNAIMKGRARAEYAWFMLAGSSAPFSVPVERAAARVIRAAERNEGVVMVGIEAKAAALLHGIAPGFTANLMGMVNRLLPRPRRDGDVRQRGLESRGWLATTLPTKAIYRSALKNNQVEGERRRVVEGIVGMSDVRCRMSDVE
jgi:short-subunit dehydrogenase